MKNQSWWLILVEGIVALALGLYLLVAPSQAWFYAGVLASIFLLVDGALEFFRNLFTRLVLRSPIRRIRGLVGMGFGAVLLLLAWLRPGWMSLATAYTILALGLIVYGGLGLWVAFFARRGRPMRWISVLINVLLLLWGVAVFFDRSSEVNLKTLSVLVLLVVGAALVVWAFITRSRGGDEDAEATPAVPPAGSSTVPVIVAPAASAVPVASVAPAASTPPAPSSAVPAVTPPAVESALAAGAMPQAGAASTTGVEPAADTATPATGDQP